MYPLSQILMGISWWICRIMAYAIININNDLHFLEFMKKSMCPYDDFSVTQNPKVSAVSYLKYPVQWHGAFMGRSSPHGEMMAGGEMMMGREIFGVALGVICCINHAKLLLHHGGVGYRGNREGRVNGGLGRAGVSGVRVNDGCGRVSPVHTVHPVSMVSPVRYGEHGGVIWWRAMGWYGWGRFAVMWGGWWRGLACGSVVRVWIGSGELSIGGLY